MKIIFKLAITILSLQLASCAFIDQLGFVQKRTVAPLDYLDNAAKMNIKNFLNGDLAGFAIVQNDKGKIESTFSIKAIGKWEDTHGTIQYNYAYNGGKKEGRTWLITMGENGEYSAIGHDFVEPANGVQIGNASRVIYSLNALYKDKKQKVEFEDKFYMIDENSAIILSTMRQGNSTLGQTIIALQKDKSK